MRNNTVYKLTIMICLTVWLLAAPGTVMAQTRLSIAVNQSVYLQQDKPITRVAIANPAIADVTVIAPAELLVVAKKAGTTTLHIWFSGDTHREYAVSVQDRDSETAAAIAAMIADPGVTVEKIGDKILLKGSIDNQVSKNRIEKIAELYGGSVISLLEMTHPLQVRIEAKIIEISTDKIKKLGIQYANAADIDESNNSVTIGTAGLFNFGQSFTNSRDRGDGRIGGYADINATLQALITNGDAQILSQPSMVTLSGETANILIGGEIPIPTSNSDGQVTVEWREYGIKLHIEPQVNAAMMITSKVAAEVSTLDSSSAAAINLNNGLSIPALRSRKAETVIRLSSGGTMAIGGLLNSEEGNQITKIPLLGDLPVLGRFFRSKTTYREKKELIILVTPTLVDETMPAVMSERMKEILQSNAAESAAKQADQEK